MPCVCVRVMCMYVCCAANAPSPPKESDKMKKRERENRQRVIYYIWWQSSNVRKQVRTHACTHYVASAFPSTKSSVRPSRKNRRTLCPLYAAWIMVADLFSSANRSSASFFTCLAILISLASLLPKYPRKWRWIITAADIGVHLLGMFGLYHMRYRESHAKGSNCSACPGYVTLCTACPALPPSYVSKTSPGIWYLIAPCNFSNANSSVGHTFSSKYFPCSDADAKGCCGLCASLDFGAAFFASATPLI